MSYSGEILQGDLVQWELGPFYPRLTTPMKLSCQLDGERIVNVQVETGYLHRGLERHMEKKPWNTGISYAGHIDPETAVFGEIAYCMAIEKVEGIQVPRRADFIRLVVSEFTRISCHLLSLARVAQAVGAETIQHFILRDREKILDLFELLAGARFSLNLIRPGGVAADVSEGFIERGLEACRVQKIRLREYDDLFMYNEIFLQRASGVGVISREHAIEMGISGPIRRATGDDLDLRKNPGYGAYPLFDFQIPTAAGHTEFAGDCHARMIQKILEIQQSISLVTLALERMPEGDYLMENNVMRGLALSSGEALSHVESVRGIFGCYLVSEDGTMPARIQFIPATVGIFSSLAELLVGLRLEDLGMVLASLDLGAGEVDR